MLYDSSMFRGKAAVAVSAMALLATLGSSPFSAQDQKPSQPPNVAVVATLPKGPMAEKATTACTECHDARIILQQRLGKAAWTREVDKMVKWGALVDSNDREALIEYLSTNFGPDQPAYEPPRTAIEKKGAGKTSK
jgi:hypothetical protein